VKLRGKKDLRCELPSISTHLDHRKHDFSDSISRSLSKIHFDQSVSREKKIESVSIVVFSKKKKKIFLVGLVGGSYLKSGHLSECRTDFNINNY
jgi:hypothetical protein